MESPRERACPSCGAPAASPQRWCLECGHELPGPRRAGLRPAVGIATMLAVLVGAASAGGYTLLQDDKHPPPPATTVAQAPPATTPETLPPATQEPPVYTPPPSTPTRLPRYPTYRSSGGSTFNSGSSSSVPSGGFGRSGGAGLNASSGDGAVDGSTPPPAQTTPREPQLALTDIALGAAAVAYAPYAASDLDLGDPSRTVDGSTRTAWKAPVATDPAAPPQLGVYVDLAGKETIRKLVLDTPTPGMSVEIYGAVSGPPGSITDPGWDHLANRSGIAARQTIGLPARPYRYVLVWIVGAPPDGTSPQISELALLSLQPE